MISIILVSSCPKPTSLIENPSSSIYNFKLNGQATSASSMTSFPSAGFTATSGNTLQTWTIETRTLDAVTQIALTNSPNVKGPIRYTFYDSFDPLAEFVAAQCWRHRFSHGRECRAYCHKHRHTDNRWSTAKRLETSPKRVLQKQWISYQSAGWECCYDQRNK